jgi:hypothetical protein
MLTGAAAQRDRCHTAATLCSTDWCVTRVCCCVLLTDASSAATLLGTGRASMVYNSWSVAAAGKHLAALAHGVSSGGVL